MACYPAALSSTAASPSSTCARRRRRKGEDLGTLQEEATSGSCPPSLPRGRGACARRRATSWIIKTRNTGSRGASWSDSIDFLVVPLSAHWAESGRCFACWRRTASMYGLFEGGGCIGTRCSNFYRVRFFYGERACSHTRRAGAPKGEWRRGPPFLWRQLRSGPHPPRTQNVRKGGLAASVNRILRTRFASSCALGLLRPTTSHICRYISLISISAIKINAWLLCSGRYQNLILSSMM